ncbi:MAG: hypothetical protein LC768_17395, partial [Acidobacteria bacterium]|nr:hypothetical protein [Acidobacteriota bacterium]
FPGIDGQIELTFYVGDKTFAFLFEEDGYISITKESKGQIIWDIYEQSYEVAEEILWEISQESQIISVSSISSTGTLETKDSEVHSFNVHQKNKTPLEVFQLSRQNASKKVNEQFVNIYRTFTAQSQATQPSFCP